MSTARSLHDLSFPELEEVLAQSNVKKVHARMLWRALHFEASQFRGNSASFPPPLSRWLNQHLGDGRAFFLDQPEQVAESRSSDGLTRKFLLRMRDGQTIETVLMGYNRRFTACISTQVGCAMGCVFCATGQMGFTRHLRPGEIIAQVLHVQRVLRTDYGKNLRNLVLMGMGEPLHNYDAVMKALSTIADVRGPSLAQDRITISTVGLVPAILRLAQERSPYNLAISLHGATEEQRRSLIPISRKWPIDTLIDACRTYDQALGKRIFIEWTLIAGKNDSPEVARQLASLLQGINVHINLIPLNPTEAYAGTASAHQAGLAFQLILRSAGYPVTFRQRRGIDVAAGCGQLRSTKSTMA